MNLVEAFFKSYFLAYFLPSSLFLIANFLLLEFIIVDNQVLLKWMDSFAELPIEFRLSAFIAIAAVLSYGLMSGNYQIVRLFEGYKFTKLLFLAKKFQEKKKKHLIKKSIKLKNKIQSKKQSSLESTLSRKYKSVRFRIERHYPKDIFDVMPTKLGNIFRSFEDYPREKYGIETIEVWPRLLLILPSNAQKHLEDAQSALMFFLTTSFLLLFLTIELILCLTIALYLNWATYPYIIFSSTSLILSLFIYRLSIESASNFGEIMKSVIDLYRKNLLSHFNLPTNEALTTKKKRWMNISKFFLYKDTKIDPFIS